MKEARLARERMKGKKKRMLFLGGLLRGFYIRRA
jgi:hypothetical protein